MKFFATLAVLAATTNLAAAETDGSAGLRVLEEIRGIWLGFNRGFYKRGNSVAMNA